MHHKYIEINLSGLLAFAKKITEAAGAYILKVLDEEEIKVEWKTSSTDLVTQVDRAVEQRLIAWIKAEYPDHAILGEEGMGNEDEAEFRWIIDPIDGTTNFIHQKVNFCISVALYRGDEGLIGIVLDPVRNEMFSAAKGLGAFLNEKRLILPKEKKLSESLIATNLAWVGRTRKWGLEGEVQEIARKCRGIRSLGAAALELAYVAAGRLDAFLSLHLSPWDYAAGKVLVEEAGGKTSDFNGASLPMKREKFGLLASHPSIHSELVSILKKE